MRLLYEWIKSDAHSVFNDFGINFTDDYNISYDCNEHILTITKKDSCIPNDLYTLNGSNVVKQVTCVLGRNGGGKTSLLKHIYKVDLIGMDGNEKYPWMNTIQVIEFNGKLNIYHNQAEVLVKCEQPYSIWNIAIQKDANEILGNGNYAQTTKIFISNDYHVGLNNNFTNNGLQGKIAYSPYDIKALQSSFFELITKQSDGIFVHRNLSYKFNSHLKKYVNPQYIHNILYCLFLRKLVKNNKRTEFDYFQKIKITFQSIGKTDSFIDSYGLYHLIMNRFSVEKIIDDNIDKKDIEGFAINQNIKVDYDLLRMCAIHQFVIKKLGVEINSIYTNLKVNLITEILLSLTDFRSDISKLDIKNTNELLLILENQIKDSNITLTFSDYKKIKYKELHYFKSAIVSIEKLKSIVPISVNEEIFLLDDNMQFLEYIYDEIKSKNSFVLKYFWLSYSCSAGERAFLNIFSNLNSIDYLKYLSNSAIKGVNKNILLILDEPDLYCHPEWQRKMLYEIIEAIELLYQGYSFHIIFSTHSPLFLSDIPRENILLLDRCDNEICAVKVSEKRTFGANIFDLYNDSFFLKSFIGEFAEYKIGKLIQKISKWYTQKSEISRAEWCEVDTMVDLIGEPIIRNKLKSMLNQIHERNCL